MDINSIFGSSGVSLIESLYGVNSKANSTEESKANISFIGADSVSISDEARKKLVALNTEKSEQENAQNENDAKNENNAGIGGGSGGGGSSNDNESKIQSLQSKLTALQAQLGKAGDSEAAGINAQINQIMAEIAALQAETA